MGVIKLTVIKGVKRKELRYNDNIYIYIYIVGGGGGSWVSEF